MTDAERQAKYKRRQQLGRRCCLIELDEADFAALARGNFLADVFTEDRDEMAAALMRLARASTYYDGLPVTRDFTT